LRSEGPQSALHVEMCMAQHLSLPAQTGHSPPLQDAAAQPVIADIRASRSICSAKRSVCGLRRH
jgi:hypothetical protein